MRKITYYSLAAALVLLFTPHALAALNTISYTANYNSSPTIGTDTLGGVTYATVSYDGLYNGGDPGKPSLPIEYIRFSVPYNATNFTVSASPGRWVNHTLSNLIYPCQAPWIPDETGTPHPITLPDTASYYSGTTYPSQFAWVVDEGFLAGENHIVTVAVMPFSYTHTSTSDVVKKARYMNVWLDYTLSDTLSMYPIVRNDSALRQEGYELTQSMVVNPNQVTSFAPADLAISFDSIGGIIGPLNGGYGLNGGGGQVIPSNPPTPGDYYEDSTLVNPDYEYNDTVDIYNYLIITSQELAYSVRRLAALKSQKGYRVKIMTLDEIYSHPASQFGMIDKNSSGRDSIWDAPGSGKIRQFLRFAFQECGTEYVLLVGSDIPGRVDSTATLIPGVYDKFLTDWHYCELNNNLLLHKYYTYPYGKETYPDLYVGRILAKTPEQVENYTDKLFRYEMNPGGELDSAMYVTKALFTAGIDFKKKFAETIPKWASVFTDRDTIFERVNDDYPKGRDVINVLNANHYGCMFSQNHGSETSIKTYGRDYMNRRYFVWANDNIENGDTTETGNGLNSILNKQFPMIYYSLACSTMPFDYEGLSFGESFTTGKDYGGPVYMGNTHTIYDAPAREMMDNFCNELPKNNYILAKADIFAKSGKSLASNPSDSKVHNFLGDPSLQMWSNDLRRFENIVVSRTNSSITISGIDTIGVSIALINNYKRRKLATVSSSSVTLNGVSPNSSIMLYKHNYIPYMPPMVLQNTIIRNSQYVIVGDVIAGNSVDNGRTDGDVIIKNGIKYEIESSGEVRLEDGFKVEKNAELIIRPAVF